jgi:nicotinate-nucleotide adenylyltransferase
VVEAPLVDISATMVRRRIKAGQSIRYLTPEPVCAYVESRKLYR